MRSEDGKQFYYEKNQLIETICQLRFPPILSIDKNEPADFQETVRGTYPRYSKTTEQPPAVNGQTPTTTENYTFLTEDGTYKLNLTKNFIALSTTKYTSWEDFAAHLDEPLGQFIRIYKPAYFERIGLRYVNAISRENLDLTGYRWNDLFQPPYLAVLDSDDIDESKVTKCSVDVEMKLNDRVSLKQHAGPGMLQKQIRTPQGTQTIQEKQQRFILDLDYFAGGNIKLAAAAETLSALHEQADKVFSEAITDTLHNAMEPTLL